MDLYQKTKKGSNYQFFGPTSDVINNLINMNCVVLCLNNYYMAKNTF